MSELEIEKCPECEEMQKSHKDYCIWCSYYKNKEFVTDTNVGSKGEKIPVISMEDVPKLMEGKE